MGRRMNTTMPENSIITVTVATKTRHGLVHIAWHIRWSREEGWEEHVLWSWRSRSEW